MTYPLPKTDAALTRKRVSTLAPFLTFIIWAYYNWAHRPILLQDRSIHYVPDAITSALFSASVAVGLSFLLVLIAQNWRRYRAVLRPNWGRAITAIIMLGLTPIVVVSWMPWIIGPFFFMGFTSGGFEPFAFFLVAFAIWYAISGLVISGVASKFWRVAIFTALWFACYSALVLALGVSVFRV